MFSVKNKSDFHPVGQSLVSDEPNSKKQHKNFTNKIDRIEDSTLSKSVRPSQVPHVNEDLSNVYRGLTGVRGVVLSVDFQQENFIGKSTLANRGVCVPLIVKWLTERDVSPNIDFFSDINSEWGREEIMYLAMQKARTGHGGAIFDYLNSKNFEMHPIKESPPKSEGLYSFSIQIDNNKGHGIALHIKKDGRVYMFDPNYGEFKLPSLNDFYKFLTPYLKRAYSDEMSTESLSYIKYLRKDKIR